MSQQERLRKTRRVQLTEAELKTLVFFPLPSAKYEQEAGKAPKDKTAPNDQKTSKDETVPKEVQEIRVPLAAFERHITETADSEATTRAKTKLETVQKELLDLFERAMNFRIGVNIAPQGVIDFVRNEVMPLMQRMIEIGEPAGCEFKVLERLRDELMRALATRSA
jgi:hypothetical protein